jgi:hypothetical protein
MVDRASLHARLSLTAHGFKGKHVKAAHVDGNSVVVDLSAHKTSHQISLYFGDAAQAQRGQKAIMAFKSNGRKPAL